ncbi:MAG: hypothetical protein QOK15_219 [Nocardioidaceae bacterium]|nr:hypothetical protein [Nocardioidaceae bacterium]
MDDGLLFVLGTGRCGSTLIHEVLARHRDVAFISNVDDRARMPAWAGRLNQPLHRLLPPEYARKGRLRFAPSEGYDLLDREVSPLLSNPYRDLVAADAQPWLSTRMVEVFETRLQAQGKNMLLHKFTGWPRIGLLHEVFPRARFINIVRDGRAVVNSWLQMPWWSGYRGPEQWWLGPLEPGDAEEYDASGRSFVVLAAIAWKILMRAYAETSSGLPESAYLELRYEDIVAEPEKAFERMTAFAGLPFDDDFRRSLGRYRFDSSRTQAFRRDLSPGAQAQLETSLREMLDRFGYA